MMTSNRDNEIEDEMRRINKRITGINKQREKDLESARYMTSLPRRKHSYGKYELFEKSKFAYMICIYILLLVYYVYITLLYLLYML